MSSVRLVTLFKFIPVFFISSFFCAVGQAGDAGYNLKEVAPIRPVAKPLGVFSDFVGGGESLANEHAKGGLVRVAWQEIEPSKDNYNWQPILDQVARMDLYSENKPWSLAIAGGKEAPSWLYEEGVASFLVLSGKEGEVEIPKFWDEQLQTHLADLAKDLASRFSDEERLALIYLPQMTINGVEGHFNQVPFETLEEAGLTADRWIDAVKQAAINFSEAFPTKPIAVELHEVIGLVEIPVSIMNELWSDPLLNHRVGVAVWWMSGDDLGYQPELIEAFKKFPGDLYGQVIGRSDQLERFPNGYAEVFEQAKRLGMRYIEPWDYEFVNLTNDPVFEDFNRWAKNNYE